MAESRRDPIIRTVPQPADMNGNGDIFGGWVLSQMDIAGGALAARVAKGRVATVAITAMTFVQPIKVGDMVSIYGEVTQGRPDLDHHRPGDRRAAPPRATPTSASPTAPSCSWRSTTTASRAPVPQEATA